ncbi:MAG: PQQ-dependent sugar dehydrogenase [Actinobacteria bacterium]|nr:PQQ-dependent sugar dehydrogenase [Actinomycetota bacterium]
MYVNERAGRVRVVERGKLRAEPLATIPTTTAGETGLLDVAVSPDGEMLYVFATHPGAGANRVLALPASGGDPEVVVDGLPAALYHNGGAVAFDDDGNLLVSNGEIHDSGDAQDPDQLGGKIYRFTPSGSAVEGNPFGAAIALGLRNPFGMTVDPLTGDAFVTDNGPTSHDEVNRIVVGGNYGWPDVLGIAGDARPSGPGDYHDPVSVREDIVVPTGIAVADPATAQEDVAGDVFYGTYAEQTIRRIELNESRDTALSDEVFIEEDDPVIAVEWGPRGLYYSTPTAIKVIPLVAQRRSPTPVQTTTPSSPPDRRDGAPASNGGSGSIYLWFGAIAVIVTAVVLLRRYRRS